MRSKQESLQYRRVDKAILMAFIQLVSRIPFEKITVQDILDEALVSRYTFYTHFPDKFAVAERLQEDCYREFLKFMQETIPEIDGKTIAREQHHQLVDTAIMEFWRERGVQIRALDRIHTETVDFERLVKEYLANNYMETCSTHQSVKLEASIYSNMAVAVMDYFSEESKLEKSLNETIMEAYANAAIYALGIHDEKLAERARTELLRTAHKNK